MQITGQVTLCQVFIVEQLMEVARDLVLRQRPQVELFSERRQTLQQRLQRIVLTNVLRIQRRNERQRPVRQELRAIRKQAAGPGVRPPPDSRYEPPRVRDARRAALGSRQACQWSAGAIPSPLPRPGHRNAASPRCESRRVRAPSHPVGSMPESICSRKWLMRRSFPIPSSPSTTRK